MSKIKLENKILIMLAFFSVSVGLWGNFRQLWMQDNNFSATNISSVISIGTFVSVIGIFIIGKYIGISKLKKYLTIILTIKFLNLAFLYFLNKTEINTCINISIVIDIVMEYMIITSIYPLITTIIKTDKTYSKRKLTEYLFRDIGILFGGVFIGKTVFGKLIDYNTCLIISNLFLLISVIIMLDLKVSDNKQDKKIHISVKEYLLKDKILMTYLLYVLIVSTANFTALGLKMLVLTNFYKFTDGIATNYLLLVGLASDIFGILALKYLTPKNDYVTMSIKFGIRFIGYLMAFLSNNLWITFAAITWSIFIGAAYEDVCDGPYINSLSSEYQLSFTNIRYIVRFLGEAIGVFFCGIMYEKGLRYMFGFSALLMIFQLFLCYKLIYMREHKTRVICKKKAGIKYRKRKCAYALIQDDRGNVAIAYDGKHFFFGGGTEENETPIDTLNREMLEETGFKLKDIALFDNIKSYEYNSNRGYLEIDATIYTAKFDEKVCEPIEKDHEIIWGKPEDHIDNMYHEYQKVMLREYIEKL
ncbi:MAG: NUDIX domain-containing protein [Bacilli bacterium]|nr:NUDIX domain-containing protein [Bacilli bacterium]